MELSITRSELKTAVAGLSRIIPNKTALPILSGVLFRSTQCVLTATATDLDQVASYRFDTATAPDGTIVLPLTALKELTKGSDKEQISFSAGPDLQVTVTNHVGGHQIRFTVNALDPADWPELQVSIKTKPAEGFLSAYRKLVPFASTDPTRYALNGVYVDVTGKGERPVCMVAVDGRRLSVWNSMKFPLRSSCLIPISRFLSWNGLNGEASIGTLKEKDREWFGLSVGPWTYQVRVPDVSFPNWRQVIPDYTADPERIHRCIFTDADVEVLRKILPSFPGHDSHNHTIVLEGHNDKLAISGRDGDAKEATVLTLEGGSRYEGPDGHIGLDRTYLLDALAAGFRTFSYVDDTSPLKSEDGAGGTHVLMPVRVEHSAPPEAAPQEAPQPQNEINPATAAVMTEPNKETRMPEKTDEQSSLDKLQAAYEAAKLKIREAQSALADLAGLIKEVAREDRQRRAEVESVRSGLAKLQAIKV